MKKSTKAVLLSALVFPGLGHFYLKRPLVGVLLLGITLPGLYYVVTQAIERARYLTDKILAGDIQPDILSITEAVSTQSANQNSQLLSYAMTGIVLCWAIGIIDAYRAGLAHDKETDLG